MMGNIVKIDRTEVMGWQGALRGMRNPKNSWDRSDTTYEFYVSEDDVREVRPRIGPNDLKLASSLIAGGPVHRKFLRMIYVTADFTMPIYLTPEFDTYKVGAVRDSCSFMHKGVSKEFEIQDFTFDDIDDPYADISIGAARDTILEAINALREKYLETKDMKYFRAIRQYIPQGHNIRFTWSANYEVLLGMYKWRKNHRLVEWHDICNWIESLPYMKEFLKCCETNC
jgi:hypothetical protein